MRANVSSVLIGIIGFIMAAFPTQAATNNSQITISLKCGGLGYDTTTGVFYASATANSGVFSNCLVRIAPLTGVMTLVTNLGAEPGKLFLSAEHRSLFVALPGQNAVRRFDLATGTLGPAFDIGGAAKQLVVMPGAPERLALIRKADLSVGLYENGSVLSGPTGYDYVSLLCSGADGSRLYGYNLNTTAYTFYRFAVGATGMSLVDGAGVFPLPGGNMKFASGRLYSGDGWVGDPETKTLLGQFPVQASGIPVGLVAPDIARNRVFVLQFQWPDSALYACEPSSFRLISSGVISNTTWSGNIMSDQAYVHDFQRWGEDGFACRTYDKILITRSTLVPSLPARDLGLSIRLTNAVVTNLQTNTYLLACTNRGPITASNAVLRFNFPPETKFVSAQNAGGTFSVSSNTVICTIKTLAAGLGTQVSVKVKVQTTNTAALLASATLSSPAADPNEDDNFALLLTMANWRTGDEQYNVVGSIAPNDATYSSLTRRYYFVFDRNAGVLAQRLVGFDPASGAFDTPVLLQPDPQKIVISADGNWLEVALGIAGEIRRVNLLTGQITNQTSLSRWQEIQAKTESQKDQNGIRFTFDRAVSLQNNQVLGTFPFVLWHDHQFEPEVPARRFYQLVSDPEDSLYGVHLRVFDTDTFRLLQDAVLPIPLWSAGLLSRWGDTGFLMRSAYGFVVWRSRLVPSAAGTDLRAFISSNPAQTITNTSFTLVATVTNAGPNPATNVSVRVWVPSQAKLTKAIASQGTLTTNADPIVLSISRLNVSSNATITLTLRATNAATLFSTAHVSSQNLDTNWGNDVAICSTVVTLPGGWPATDTALNFPISVNDLVYEPVSQRLFASVGSGAGIYGNSVLTIDPATGQAGPVWFVGSEPAKLAVSDDGQFLYVSVTGAGSVRRIRLADGVLDQAFSIGDGSASDLAVQPGHPDTVALIRYMQDLSIYRNGQRLAKSVSAFDIQVIRFNETGDKLFGYDSAISDFLFSVINVTSNGVSIASQGSGLLVGFDESFSYEGGLVFGTTGIVFDPIARLPRGILPGVSAAGGLAPHFAAGRAYGMTANGSRAVVRSYEINHMTVLDEQSYPAATDYPGLFQLCGGNRLAYRTGSAVVMLHSSLVPVGPPADLMVQFQSIPARVQLNKPFTVRLSVTNAGPDTAQNCVVGVGLPPGVSLVSASCGGGWIQSGVWYACVPNKLNAGESLDWTLAFKSTTPGLKLMQAFVTADVTDPHAENDVTSCFIPTGLELAAGSKDELTVPVRTLVYSSARNKLYAAIPAGVFGYGNTVMEIDPVTSNVRGPLFVGSEPVALAVTDDGRSLYVSLFGMGGMRRIDLDTWRADPMFPVGPEVNAAVALAGITNGIVLSHGSDASVFLGGTRTAYLNNPVAQLLRGSGSRLYGYNSRLPTMPIVNLTASPYSIVDQGQWSGPFFTAGVDLRFAAGRIFSNRGDVLDPEAHQILGLFSGFSQVNSFAPESDGSRLYTIRSGLLQLWETTNYQVGAASLVSPTNAVTSDLLRWGADGLAFLEDDYPVWLRSSLVRTASGTDTDQDGMPDAWELLHGLNPNQASDGFADPDQDGVLNRNEFLVGTDPQFAEGPLRLFAGDVSMDGILVRFAGQTGRHYRIEYTTTLSPAAWQPLVTGLIGQGSMISYTCQFSGNQGFLRVIDESAP